MTYSCKFTGPRKCSVLACGVDSHATKLFSTTTGGVLHSYQELDSELNNVPVVALDTSKDGKLAIFGSTNGVVAVFNMIKFDIPSIQAANKKRYPQSCMNVCNFDLA